MTKQLQSIVAWILKKITEFLYAFFDLLANRTADFFLICLIVALAIMIVISLIYRATG